LFNCRGKEVIINATKDMKFSELALKFMDNFGIITNDQPLFIYNSMRIDIDCCKSLGELEIRIPCRIDVFICRKFYDILKIDLAKISVILFF